MVRPLAEHSVAVTTRVSHHSTRWLVIITVPLLLISMLILSIQNWAIALAATEYTVGDCTASQTHETIQDAVNASVPDTIINICSGIYSESVNLSRMSEIGNITLRDISGDVYIEPEIGSGIYITPNTSFTGNITIVGIEIAADVYGIDFASFVNDSRSVYGEVVISDVVARNNPAAGASIAAVGSVTVENSSFITNRGIGLDIEIVAEETYDTVVQLAAPNIYIENVVADGNLGDGIKLHGPNFIEVYDSQANNNGNENGGGGSSGSGIFITHYGINDASCEAKAEYSYPPFVEIASVSTNDNVGAWGILVDSQYDVYIYDVESINNPYDGVAVSAYDNCYYNEIELADSLAMSNGWATGDINAIEENAIEGRIAPQGADEDMSYGGFRLRSGGDLFVYTSEYGFDEGLYNEAIANEGFGYCLTSDFDTLIFDSWATDNNGDGFRYNYGEACDGVFMLGADADIAEEPSQPKVRASGAPVEGLVIANSSAINNNGAGFEVIDSSLLVAISNITAQRNITGIAFDEPVIWQRTTGIDPINVQGEGLAGPTLIVNSLIQSNTGYGLVYGQQVAGDLSAQGDLSALSDLSILGNRPLRREHAPLGDIAIQGTDSLTSTNFATSNIICENGEGLGAFQYLPIGFVESIDTQLLIDEDHLLFVDATGNWWGDAGGPDAPGNSNPEGDSIIIQSANIAIFDDETIVEYDPWISMIVPYALPNPTILGVPVEVAFQFTDGAAYFLNNGIGNLNEAPIFHLNATNGAVAGGSGKYIEDDYLEGTVIPSGAGIMSVNLTGPCGLNSTQQILVATPQISIEKFPDAQGIASGETALFTVTVTNSGNIELTDVEVADSSTPNCARAIGVLPAGESETYTCSRTNVTTSYLNSATATGSASINGSPTGPEVTATDSAQVYIASFSLAKTVYVDGYFEVIGNGLFNPSDCALKSDITVPSGTTVKYCYTITNTGDYTLSTHSLVDSHIPGAILSSFPHELGQDASFSTIDAGVKVTQTLTVSTTNVATWTAQIAPPIVSLGANAIRAAIPVVFSSEATVTMSPADLDQDNDGIPDVVEGSGDINTNGIPDFLDPFDATNEPPTEQPTQRGSIYLPSLSNED